MSINDIFVKIEFCGTWKNLNKNLQGNLISINKFSKPTFMNLHLLQKKDEVDKLAKRVDRIFNAKEKHSIACTLRSSTGSVSVQ